MRRNINIGYHSNILDTVDSLCCLCYIVLANCDCILLIPLRLQSAPVILHSGKLHDANEPPVRYPEVKYIIWSSHYSVKLDLSVAGTNNSSSGVVYQLVSLNQAQSVVLQRLGEMTSRPENGAKAKGIAACLLHLVTI